MVLVVDEEEVFAMPEDPARVLALSGATGDGACGGRGGGVRDAGGPCGGAGVLALSGVTGDGAALEEEPLSHPAEGQEGSACVVPTEILKGSVLWVAPTPSP